MELLKVKTARFGEIVKQCGVPGVITFWQEPKNDKPFQQALREQRVMTMHQTIVGTKKDFAEVGFVQGPNLSHLVFQKSLKDFAGRRIIGIDYGLLAKKQAEPTNTGRGKVDGKKRALVERRPKLSARIEPPLGPRLLPEPAKGRARPKSQPAKISAMPKTQRIRQTPATPSPADPFMLAAINEARKGLEEGGIPIGSALVREGRLVAVGHNKRVQEDDPVTHAETDCLRQAGRIGSFRGCTLYSTLMPCFFCAGAAVQFGIKCVVVGESRNFTGAPEFMREHGIEVLNLDLPECYEMMGRWIRQHPKLWNEDIGKP